MVRAQSRMLRVSEGGRRHCSGRRSRQHRVRRHAWRRLRLQTQFQKVLQTLQRHARSQHDAGKFHVKLHCNKLDQYCLLHGLPWLLRVARRWPPHLRRSRQAGRSATRRQSLCWRPHRLSLASNCGHNVREADFHEACADSTRHTTREPAGYC